MNKILIIDNFFKDPDLIRNCALQVHYQEPQKNDGWRGYRSNQMYSEIQNYVKKVISSKIPKIKNCIFKCWFHYSLEETKKTCFPSFEDYKIHTDNSLFAGVVYLSPNSIKNCGTSFYDSNRNLIKEYYNLYNRLVFYPSSILHAPTNLFGKDLKSSRMTLTIFVY